MTAVTASAAPAGRPFMARVRVNPRDFPPSSSLRRNAPRSTSPRVAQSAHMTSPINSVTTPWYRQASKLVTAVASTGAACVSIFSFLYSYGILGKSEAHQTVGNLGVAWVGLRPAADTATPIGDTLHLAATITDRAGAILVGTKPAWSSENSARRSRAQRRLRGGAGPRHDDDHRRRRRAGRPLPDRRAPASDRPWT